MNISIISGFLGQDPTKSTTKTGKTVTKFSVAVSSGFGDKRRTDWFDVNAWGKLGEACATHIKKGSYVVVRGFLRNENFETKEGKKIKKDSLQALQVDWPPRGKAEADADADDPNVQMEKASELDIPF